MDVVGAYLNATLPDDEVLYMDPIPGLHDGVVLKHKNVSSIEEYNIGDRLKYSRIKQSSKKDIEESRINVKYQEHYRSIWNSAKCKMQSTKYKVQSVI